MSRNRKAWIISLSSGPIVLMSMLGNGTPFAAAIWYGFAAEIFTLTGLCLGIWAKSEVPEKPEQSVPVTTS